ncbi:MAG: hypothetical protein ABIB55_01900 [Candidatus Nealsonbacteria bacterium]
MVNVRELKNGMTLLTHEYDELQEREKAMFGSVFGVDAQRQEVILMIKGELRTFPANRLWRLPYEAEVKKTITTSMEKMLMGFIVGINDGLVSTAGLQEIANAFKGHGIKPVRTQELVEVL